MNKMTLIGNLTRDPELRTLQDGSSVCSFTVAVNRRSGKDHPEADFFRVSAWGQMGEACAKYLSKGKKVFVAGPLRARTYQDSRGETRIELGVTASDVEFLTPRERGADAQTAQGAADTDGAYTPVTDEDVPF